MFVLMLIALPFLHGPCLSCEVAKPFIASRHCPEAMSWHFLWWDYWDTLHIYIYIHMDIWDIWEMGNMGYMGYCIYNYQVIHLNRWIYIYTWDISDSWKWGFLLDMNGINRIERVLNGNRIWGCGKPSNTVLKQLISVGNLTTFLWGI